MVNEKIPATPFTAPDDPVKGTKRTLEISGGRELYVYEFEMPEDAPTRPEREATGGSERGETPAV